MGFFRILGVYLAIIIGLPSCVKTPKYRQKSLESLHTRFDYAAAKNNVMLRAKKLTKEENRKLFGIRGKALSRESNIPAYTIYLSIHNLSNKLYVLSPDNISLTLEPYQKIAKRMQSSTVVKAAGTLAGGTVASIITAGGGLYALFAGAAIGSTALVFGAKAALVAVPIIVIGTPIAAIIKSIRATKINRKVKRDICDKTLHAEIVIYPGQQFDTLIFVKRLDYRTNFTITLHEEDNEEDILAFDVSLNQNRFIRSS